MKTLIEFGKLGWRSRLRLIVAIILGETVIIEGTLEKDYEGI